MITGVIITKDPGGNDLDTEITVIDPVTGNGVDVSATMTASVQQKLTGFYFDFGGSDLFDSVAEVSVAVPYDSEGLHSLVLPGGASIDYQKYHIHIIITAAGDLNTNSKYSDVIGALDLSGYQGGFVYVDQVNGTPGVVLGRNGTFNKPVNNNNEAKIIADQLSKKIAIRGAVNFNQIFDNYHIKGIDGGARVIGDVPNGSSPRFNGTFFEDIQVTGYIPCDVNTKFLRGLLDSIDQLVDGLVAGEARDCVFKNKTITKAQLNIVNGFSFDENTQIQYGNLAASALEITVWSGELLITDMVDAADALKVYSDGDASITMDVTNTDGDATFVGIGNKDTAAATTAIDETSWAELPLSGSGLTQQQTRDSMKLAPTGGVPDAGSVDKHLDDINVVTNVLAVVDGVNLEDREKFTLAYVKGKIGRSGNAYTYFAQNGSTALFTLTGDALNRIPS